MAVSNTTLRSPDSGGYACNGSTTDFTGNFRLLAEGDVKVILADSDGAETTLTLTTEYTVSPTGGSYPADSFTVTTVSTYASGNTITLIREMDLTQPTSYGNGGPYVPSNNETSYDRNLLIIQQQQEVLDRCVKNAASATSATDPDSYLLACQTAQAGAETAETAAEAAQTAAEAAAASITSVLNINTQAGAAYTISTSDLGGVVRMTSSGVNVVTIPPYSTDQFSVGSTIVVKQSGSGTTILTGGTGVTLNGVLTGSGAMQRQYGDVMLQNVAQDVWEVSGAITTVS